MCLLTPVPLLQTVPNICGRVSGIYVFNDRRAAFGERREYSRAGIRILCIHRQVPLLANLANIYAGGYPEFTYSLTGAPLLAVLATLCGRVSANDFVLTCASLLSSVANIFGRLSGIYVFIDRRAAFANHGEYLRTGI